MGTLQKVIHVQESEHSTQVAKNKIKISKKLKVKMIVYSSLDRAPYYVAGIYGTMSA